MNTETRFEVTDLHLKLLAEMYVRWDDSEFGAPAIDSKRPYGNSYVYGDIAEIMGLSPDEDGDFSDDQQSEMDDIHHEMETVLQILLHNANRGIQPGVYTRENPYGGEWKRKS